MDNSPELDALLARLDTGASRDRISAAADVAELEVVERDLLGRRSGAREVREAIKGLDPSERPVAGRALSSYEAGVREMLAERATALAAAAAGEAGAAERLDLTLGGHGLNRGHHHLVTQVQRELEDIFVAMGYAVAEGPEVEDDWHNFEALNFPPDHPARTMHDTFWFGDGRLLRTHTSPVQIRAAKGRTPPIRIIAPGKVYRSDSDQTHSPMFHQVEGLLIDETSTMADLKGTLREFLRAFFDRDFQMRFKPTFFPFVEPGADVIIRWDLPDGGSRWLEVLGCGMVHPNVLRNCGIDPERYSGFAFGMGVERLAMLRYGVSDLRAFFDNDVRFLRQFA